MTTLEDVKKNLQIKAFIQESEEAMIALGYTDHGFRHADIVASRAKEVAKKVGLSEREQELSAIAGYCHDMGNFMTRTYHHYFGSSLFFQIFQNSFEPTELPLVMQAIANHDKKEMDFSKSNEVSAVLVLADKSDVDRSRVTTNDMEEIKADIHNRVNYATTENELDIDEKKKTITLHLTIDTNFTPIIEYFEIFTERMSYCRTAAEFLGFKFGIIINKTRLL